MVLNHNVVTSVSERIARADGHIAAVREVDLHLQELYKQPMSDARGIKIADAHHLMRLGFKFAELEALLAIATGLTAKETSR